MSSSLTLFQTWLSFNKDVLTDFVFHTYFGLEEAIEQFCVEKNSSKLEEILGRIRLFQQTNLFSCFPEALKFDSSDCFVLVNDYPNALISIPPLRTDNRLSRWADRVLTLKHLTRTEYSASDLISLFRPNVTAFGKNFLDQIELALDASLPNRESRKTQLSQWAASSETEKYQLFSGKPIGYDASNSTNLMEIKFSRNVNVMKDIYNITRDAENKIRESCGLPNVGEGWISETKLFYEIKQAFDDLVVIQHASPFWLGRQHLDIYIPQLRVAVEYQGIQHDKIVNFFGGEEGYKQTKKRDIKKSRLCQSHGIRLIYVRPDYDIKDVIEEIHQKKTKVD